MKYQNFKLRQAVLVCFMTMSYWGKRKVISNRPPISGHWLPPLRFMRVDNGEQVAQCRVLFIVIVLIVDLLLTFSTWLRLWEDISIRIFKAHLFPFVAAPLWFGRALKDRILLSLHLSSLWWESSVRREGFFLGLSPGMFPPIGIEPDEVLSILGHS